MSDLQTSLVVNLAGNLAQRAQKYSRSIEQMSQRGQKSMRLLNRSANMAGKGLDKLGNRYTTLFTGAGLTLAARQVVGLETRFERLGIQANKTKTEMDALKQTVFDVAQEKEIRVDPSQITSAIEAIVEKTGDLEFAKNNIRNIGMAIQATDAEGNAIGEVLAEFQKMGMVDPSNILKTLDTLNVQGKEGAFTLQNLASLGPRVITAYTATGRTGSQAMREMGAALQMIRMGTGSSEMAATAFEATMRSLTDPKKIQQLQNSGIQIFDPKAAEEGKRVLRPINEIMGEIIKKVNGDATKLGLVFDAEAVRAFNAASSEFQRTGSLTTLQKFMDVQGDGTTTMRDSARAAKTSEAALQNLFTAWQQFQDNELSGPIQDAADALNSLEPGTVQNWLEIGKNIALVGGAAIILKKSAGAFGTLRDMKNGGKAGGIGGAISSMGAQRVFVVNMGMGGMGAGKGSVGKTPQSSVIKNSHLSGALPKSAPIKAPSKWATVGKYAGKFGGAPLAIAGGGLAMASTLSSDASFSEKKTGLMEIGGGMAGAGAGAAALAWIPIVGPLVGGAIGYYAGEKIGRELSNVTFDGGLNDGRAPRMNRAHTVSDKTIIEALSESLASGTAVNKNRRAGSQNQREARAELKVSVEDNRTTVKSVRATGMDLDIAGNSMAMGGL